uniref:Serine/threonine-protein phosphatase 4 regulatory subunit 3-like central domain-containing protein n=1 Tax=Arcella intermedia TaxID=1963864 RepID=A0A6B2L0Q9_9EUKA
MINKVTKTEFILEELLEEDDIVLLLQYMRYKYLDVLEFFKKPEVLDKLIDYVVEDATAKGTNARAVQLTKRASEILSAQIPDLDEVVIEKEDLMGRLYDYWEDSEIDHLRANLIVKIISSINEAQPEKAVEFLKNNPQILPAFMKHLENASTADFFAHLCRLEEYSSGVHQWLVDMRILDRLLDQFGEKNRENHSEVAEIVKVMVLALRWNSPLMEKLFSHENIEDFLYIMSDARNPTAFQYGCEVFISMLRALNIADIEKNTTHDPYGPLEQLPPVITILMASIPKFVEELEKDDRKTHHSVCNETIEVFGWHRYNVLNLIYSLISLKYSAINQELDKSNIFSVIIDQMFRFAHNSFCHTLVEKIAMSMLSLFETELIESFLRKTNLATRILDTEKLYQKDKTKRKEYMPNIYNLAERIDRMIQNYSFMAEFIKGREGEWKEMVDAINSQTLRLRASQIVVDRNAPRGKVIVEDEEGFTKSTPLPAPKSEQSPPSPKTTPTKSLFTFSDEDLLDDAKFGQLSNLDALDDYLKLDSLDDLPGEEKNVLSAIDAILDGSYDNIVLDKDKLHGLTLDDILG